LITDKVIEQEVNDVVAYVQYEKGVYGSLQPSPKLNQIYNVYAETVASSFIEIAEYLEIILSYENLEISSKNLKIASDDLKIATKHLKRLVPSLKRRDKAINFNINKRLSLEQFRDVMTICLGPKGLKEAVWILITELENTELVPKGTQDTDLGPEGIQKMVADLQQKNEQGLLSKNPLKQKDVNNKFTKLKDVPIFALRILSLNEPLWRRHVSSL